MKRLISIIFLICVLVLSGCNADTSNTSDTTNGGETIFGESTNTSPNNGSELRIEEKRFLLPSDGYQLNAVYTYIDDGKARPAVLLIAGSGPSDCDETVGALKPFEDIAHGLAQEGINSLRVDKRTFSYAADFDIKCGIKEEYIDDCNAAIEYLKTQNISSLYLLGHSLGGQIATELAKNTADIDGMILFNSSARHLADIACDQYSAIDPVNKSSYITYAEAAKNVTASSAKGYYYYNASDHYWVSYNQMDTAKNISDANIKTLIINSKFDNQSFNEDLNLWSTLFSDSANVSICVYDDISHFGYKIDTSDPSSIYTRVDFPSEVITAFADFIKEN
ncbi:MAG: alpha/beta hydrolase [Clostridia bacterium]|nr:alpha/beta hydrolase [Clostridia bacterium]